MNKGIKLPCLRGRMGDWFYYVSLMNFSEIAKRASMVPEIHKNEMLSRWIQREINDRTNEIVEYLLTQEQRFFNAIIFGIYGGMPQWQEIDIVDDVEQFTEEEKEYFGKTFGVLILNGQEKIFAIDGQHRTKAIMDAVKEDEELRQEEVAVIFLAHKKTPEGEVRTRRLFSTLNRYAVPVTPSEIIALDEEDNCAIITRKLIEEVKLFENRIIFSKSRSLSPKNTTAFTNIILLYDIIVLILTNIDILNIKVSGHQYNNYIKRRDTEQNINNETKRLELLFRKVFTAIPSLNKFFFEKNLVNRESATTSLLFRPIGQIVLFSVIKVAIENSKLAQAINYFKKDNFNISNPIWRKVFVDPELGNLRTDKSLQKFAIQIILIHLGIDVQLTKKEKVVFDNFNINPKKL